MNFSHSKAKKPPSENAKVTLVSQLQPHPLPLPILPLGVPQVPPSQHLLPNQHKSPPSFDFIFDPSKKIKHTQDTFTQRVSEVQEVPLKERTLQGNKLNFLRGESDNTLPKNLVSYLPENTGMDLTQQIPFNQYYSRNGLNPRDISTFLPSPTVLDLLKYQQLEQQLRQQQMINQFRVHHQLFNQVESQQLKPVLPQAFTTPSLPGMILPQVMKTNQNFPLSLLNQQSEALRKNYLMKKSEPVLQNKSVQEPKKSSLFASEKQEIEAKVAEKNELQMPDLKDDTDLQLLKESKLAVQWEAVSSSSEGQAIEQKKAKINKTKPKIKKPRVKKVKQENQDKRHSLIQQELEQVKNAESRRKNKWQMIAEQKLQETSAEDQSLLSTGQERKWQREDERSVDYEYLLSVMITNDPCKIGRENSEANFVVLTRDTVNKEVVSDRSGPRVGSKYQVSVADSQLKSQRKEVSRRKIPELMWNPDIVSENQLIDYVDSLCKMLKCERINTERALKLLKRKDSKKDKVLLNISKNEKFYSAFLVVKDEISGIANNESVAQQPDMSI